VGGVCHFGGWISHEGGAGVRLVAGLGGQSWLNVSQIRNQ